MTDRYDISEHPEGQFEPGSDKLVLSNKLGVTEPHEMANIELMLLARIQNLIPDIVTEDQALTADDLCEWHRRWLGNVYSWAGKVRSVNIGKDGFLFATAAQIPRLLERFDKDVLSIHTPCVGMTDVALVNAIAVTHIEFILIHPFREGNGRLSRLLANTMAMQAGMPELDFTLWDENKESYFAAIQHGLTDYEPMKALVRQVLFEP